MISFVHALCGMLYNIYHWYCGVLYNIYNWYLIVAQPWWALVTSPLAQGGRLGKYREVTHVAPGHLNWNLVIWASLSTGLQGRGTVPPRVFDGIAGYVWVCVGGVELICKHIACCARGSWTNVHPPPRKRRGGRGFYLATAFIITFMIQ